MNVKKVLKFYFTADRAERLIDALIARRAYAFDFTRCAERCAEEVACLVHKKGEMCRFYNYVDGAAETFTAEERGVLRRYALLRGKRPVGEEGREMHRLAVAFARRIRGCGEHFAEGIAAAMEFSFIL